MSDDAVRAPTVRELIAFARAGSAAALEARLAPLVLVGPPVDTNPDWAYRTASLNVVRESINGQELLLDAGFVVHAVKKKGAGPFASTILIGRSASNDICVQHSSVSKLHARITRQADGTSLISDAGSSNGTLVQGKALAPREARALTPGLLVVVGACHFTVVDAVRLHDILQRIDP